MSSRPPALPRSSLSSSSHTASSSLPALRSHGEQQLRALQALIKHYATAPDPQKYLEPSVSGQEGPSKEEAVARLSQLAAVLGESAAQFSYQRANLRLSSDSSTPSSHKAYSIKRGNSIDEDGGGGDRAAELDKTEQAIVDSHLTYVARMLSPQAFTRSYNRKVNYMLRKFEDNPGLSSSLREDFRLEIGLPWMREEESEGEREARQERGVSHRPAEVIPPPDVHSKEGLLKALRALIDAECLFNLAEEERKSETEMTKAAPTRGEIQLLELHKLLKHFAEGNRAEQLCAKKSAEEERGRVLTRQRASGRLENVAEHVDRTLVRLERTWEQWRRDPCSVKLDLKDDDDEEGDEADGEMGEEEKRAHRRRRTQERRARSKLDERGKSTRKAEPRVALTRADMDKYERKKVDKAFRRAERILDPVAFKDEYVKMTTALLDRFTAEPYLDQQERGEFRCMVGLSAHAKPNVKDEIVTGNKSIKDLLTILVDTIEIEKRLPRRNVFKRAMTAPLVNRGRSVSRAAIRIGRTFSRRGRPSEAEALGRQGGAQIGVMSERKARMYEI